MGFLTKYLSANSTARKPKKQPDDKEAVVLCPHCQTSFPKIPLSKTACNKCHQFIFVRTHFETEKKLYLSEAQKNSFDKERMDFFFQKDWLRKFSEMGIQETKIEALRLELFKKWGKTPSFHDLAWRIFNNQVINLSKKGTTLHELKMLYFTWALFACEINSDPTDLLKQSHKYQLLEYKKSGFINEVEILSNQGCKSCGSLNKQRFKIDALLTNNDILPNKHCTHKLNPEDKHPWCRCMFLAITSLS